MDFVITCLPGLGPLLADELTELGISVTDPGNAHVGIQGLQQDALRACLWSRLAERVLVLLAELDVTPDQAPERLAAAVDWRALVPPGVDLHLSLDHGKGVREEDIPLLLQPFSRGEKARTLSGSGLGLAIVKRIVDMHHGEMALDNHPHGGLRVTIRFPLTGQLVQPETLSAGVR